MEAVLTRAHLQIQTCIFIHSSLFCSPYNFYRGSGPHRLFIPGCRHYHENTQTISIASRQLSVLFNTQINVNKLQTQAAFISAAFRTYCTFKQLHQCILIREALQAGSRERKENNDWQAREQKLRVRACVCVCVIGPQKESFTLTMPLFISDQT